MRTRERSYLDGFGVIARIVMAWKRESVTTAPTVALLAYARERRLARLYKQSANNAAWDRGLRDGLASALGVAR